jgi:Rrf2 family transcriptional regulator, iron-sulfur cluster assembly transcription factor
VGTGMGCKKDRSRCLTHDLWEELGNQIQLYLNSVTLADVCQRRIVKAGRQPVAEATPQVAAQ